MTTFQYFGLQLCHNTDVYLNLCLPPFPHLKELVLAAVLLKITWDHTFFHHVGFFWKLNVSLFLMHLMNNMPTPSTAKGNFCSSPFLFMPPREPGRGYRLIRGKKLWSYKFYMFYRVTLFSNTIYITCCLVIVEAVSFILDFKKQDWLNITFRKPPFLSTCSFSCNCNIPKSSTHAGKMVHCFVSTTSSSSSFILKRKSRF